MCVQPTATQCNTLQHTATHRNTVRHDSSHICDMTCSYLRHDSLVRATATHCNTLQHSAIHYNTLHHTASHCITLHHIATLCEITHWCVQRDSLIRVIRLHTYSSHNPLIDPPEEVAVVSGEKCCEVRVHKEPKTLHKRAVYLRKRALYLHQKSPIFR